MLEHPLMKHIAQEQPARNTWFCKEQSIEI